MAQSMNSDPYYGELLAILVVLAWSNSHLVAEVHLSQAHFPPSLQRAG